MARYFLKMKVAVPDRGEDLLTEIPRRDTSHGLIAAAPTP